MRSSFRRERGGQVAVADAVLTLIILTLASTILYSTIAGVVTSNSESRQRNELYSTAMSVGTMPLEASCPEAGFVNLSSGEVHEVINITGIDLLRTYFELQIHSSRTGHEYDLQDLETSIKDLYLLALRGRSYAVHAYVDHEGTYLDILFSTKDEGKGAMTSVTDIPHPRVVAQKVLHQGDLEITVDLYLWK